MDLHKIKIVGLAEGEASGYDLMGSLAIWEVSFSIKVC